MGFFLRKSFRVGPLRLNLSRRGVGVSAGVKGARVGIDASGHEYVQGGRYGLYFRERGRRVAAAGGGVLVWIVLAAVAVVAVLAALAG